MILALPLAAAGLFGLAVGSFLNVVVHRVPEGRSVVTPRSSCGSCGHEIRWYDNIPVVSWIVLRARCRDCGSRIPARYPALELAGASAFLLVGVVLGPQLWSAGSPADAIASVAQLAAFIYLAAISLALAVIDVQTMRLPNAIVLPAYPVTAVLLTAAAVLGGAGDQLLGAVAGLAIMGGLYLVIAFVKPGAMGMGDVKLAGVLGFCLGWLGWSQLAVGILGGFLIGGVVGLVLLATRGRTARIPFGPWLLAGAWLGILVGREVATGYLSLYGLSA